MGFTYHVMIYKVHLDLELAKSQPFHSPSLTMDWKYCFCLKMLASPLNILLNTQEKGSNTCTIFLLGLMRSRAEYWCSFWLTPFEWVFAENFYHFWHHDFTSLLLHLLYTLLTWVTHFIFHNKIPVESSHELLRSPTLQATLPHTNAT